MRGHSGPGDKAEVGPKLLGEWLGRVALGCWLGAAALGCGSLGAEGESGRLTLPSPEEQAILRKCSCSEGSEAYWASS